MALPAPSASPRYTGEDLERLSAQGYRYELIKGELRPMSPAGGPHGFSGASLAGHLLSYINEHDLGLGSLAETGYLIGRNPDTVLAPDFGFISWERVPDPLPSGWVPVVPDLVVETRSPGDTRREVAEKVRRWLEAGVRVVLDQDPETRTLHVHRQDGEPEALGIGDVLTLDDVLPGFTAPVERLFPRSRPR